VWCAGVCECVRVFEVFVCGLCFCVSDAWLCGCLCGVCVCVCVVLGCVSIFVCVWVFMVWCVWVCV